MQNFMTGIIGSTFAALIGLVPVGALAEGSQVAAAELVYSVREDADLPPYRNRILVTPEAVRMDDGSGAGNFVLFDRESRVIYSVSSGEKTILVVDPPKILPQAPESLVHTQARREQEGAPPIRGVTPVEVDFLANGELCYSAAVVPGVLTSATQALAEFHAVLALQQAVTLPMLPEDAASPCELATHVYAAGREYAEGLPVRVWNPEGQGQELLDFSEGVKVEAALFQPPPGYRSYSLGDVGSLTAPR